MVWNKMAVYFGGSIIYFKALCNCVSIRHDHINTYSQCNVCMHMVLSTGQAIVASPIITMIYLCISNRVSTCISVQDWIKFIGNSKVGLWRTNHLQCQQSKEITIFSLQHWFTCTYVLMKHILQYMCMPFVCSSTVIVGCWCVYAALDAQ